ncbi:hypothetical protein V8E36_008593 [Tilletia maclaganii]
MASHEQLVQDLLPSPTTEQPSSRPTPPSRSARPITTEDLQHKSCWICAGSEDDDEDVSNNNVTTNTSSSTAGARTNARRKSSRKKFVHPCKCTLVAHQSCLLHWIAQSRQNKPNEAVKCPQCQAQYVVIEDRPWLLHVLEWADRQVSKAVSINVWVLLSTTTLLGATAYGCVAIRLALGKEAAARTLRAPWPLRYYIQIPLIPFALVASKLHFLRLFDPLTPWMIAFLPSFAHLPLPFFGAYRGIAAQRRLTNRRSFTGAQQQQPVVRSWPPNPGPTAMLIPFVRFAYLFLRTKISRRFLRPLLSSRRTQRDQERESARGGRNQSGTATAPTRTQRVVVLGAEGVEGRLFDADPPPGAAAVVESEREATDEEEEMFNGGDHDDVGGESDDDDLEGFAVRRNGTVRQQTVYITRQSVGRLVLNALTLPLAAAGMGSLLASITRLTAKGSWLRHFLGMNFDALDGGGWKSPTGIMQDLFAPTLTSSEGSTPLSRIFSPRATAGSGSASSASPTSQTFQRAASAEPTSSSSSYYQGESHAVGSPAWLAQLALNGGPSIYDDLVDAPWFRNAVGGLLFIALQDAFRITYRYLKLKQRGRMTVRDLPFEQHLASSLDLRPGR